MANLFTSDTHYGSERTLEFSRRPFSSVAAMNDAMVAGVNALATEADTLYHVGDFGDYNFVKELAPRVVLICGNYEQNDVNVKFGRDFELFRNHLIDLGFADVVPNSMFVDGMFLNHYPSKRIQDCFSLFGHIHRLQMVKRNALNVGVDCHDYRPVDADRLQFFRNAIESHYDNDVFCL